MSHGSYPSHTCPSLSFQSDIVFESTSPKDAIRRVSKVYSLCERNNVRISYYAKQFLEALAISAETDLHEVK